MAFNIAKNLVISSTLPYTPANSSLLSYTATGEDYYFAFEVVNATNQEITVSVCGADYLTGTVVTQFGQLPLSNNPQTVSANSTGAISFNVDDIYMPLLYTQIQVTGTVIPSGTINVYVSSRPYMAKVLR